MSESSELNHLSSGGEARMVNVGRKPVTRRRAVAEAWVTLGPQIAMRLRKVGGMAKGNVLETARIAGIMAAKHTATLIPMCHTLTLDAVDCETTLSGDRVHIVAKVATAARTGVEMEAMTAVSVAALTVYDMVKSAGPGVEIGQVRLLEKEGGKSGHWIRQETAHGQG
jgi:cyclic pyranopterin phosphate synthase